MRFGLLCLTSAIWLSGCTTAAPAASAAAGFPLSDPRAVVQVDPGGDEPPALLHMSLLRGWEDPWFHRHASQAGTPFVHAFLLEPAFLGRDVFVDVGRSAGETEVETEIEWALTRRLGLIAEIPYIDAESGTGVGDLVLGARSLLVEEERFLLSYSRAIVIPTGDEDRGLGGGAWAFSGSLHTWLDLGGWFTAQTQTGLGLVPKTGEVVLPWAVGISKSFPVRPLFGSAPDDAHVPHVVSIHAEVRGETFLDGPREGETTGEVLVGLSYPIRDGLDIRGAWTRTFNGKNGWFFGLIVHL